MIDEAEIEKAVELILTGSGLFPRIGWENKDLPQVRPYLTMQVVPAAVDDETLAQTRPVWTGFIVLTVITALNIFTTPGKAIRKQAGDLFTAGTRINLDSGKKLICRHPNPLPPYRAGEDYRLPLRINIQTEG